MTLFIILLIIIASAGIYLYIKEKDDIPNDLDIDNTECFDFYDNIEDLENELLELENIDNVEDLDNQALNEEFENLEEDFDLLDIEDETEI
jgi:hypothetical protein